MKRFRGLMIVLVAGTFCLSAHAMPIGLRIALMGRGAERQRTEYVSNGLKAGEYFCATLTELGYDVPTNGTLYSVTALGMPTGLQLKYNAAVKDKKGKVIKKAKSEWWIEGVPTAAMDFFENPAYLVITTNGVAETYALPIEVLAQEVVDLNDETLWGEVSLGQSMTAAEPFCLPGVTNSGWTVSGLPSGLKYAAKLMTTKKKVGKKTVVTTNALPYSVYGKTTKAGLFTVTAKKKVNALAARSTSGTGSLPVHYETLKYRVLVKPAAVDAALFGEELANITTMAYVPVVWDLMEGGEWDGGHAGRVTLPGIGKVAKVTGLPAGVYFVGQMIAGTPTKAGTYVVTFTKNVKEKVKGKTQTVAKTAQILWKVEPNDAKVELGFNVKGGVIESGVVGLKYGELLAFSATSNAMVTASGLPEGMRLVKVEGGHAGCVTLPGGETVGGFIETALPGYAWWGFEGVTAKAGTYLVTVTATVKGRSVTQRLALEVKGLPAWAKGTFNGGGRGSGTLAASGAEGSADGSDMSGASPRGLATVMVSAAGKISGKFQEFGTNWTFTAASFTGAARRDEGIAPYQTGEAGTRDACPYQAFECSNVVAKYAYKVTEVVKGKTTTITKYVTREFVLKVVEAGTRDACPYRGVVTMEETGGSQLVATEIEAWQNLWGRADYKALGKRLFYTSKKVPYKTFKVDVYTNDAGQVCFVGDGEGGHAGRVTLPDGTVLTYYAALSLKVTTAGAVTATLTFDTGKTKKDPKTKKTVKVYYKPTCQSVVVPLVAADAETFAGTVPLYFAPKMADGFEGFAGSVVVQ